MPRPKGIVNWWSTARTWSDEAATDPSDGLVFDASDVVTPSRLSIADAAVSHAVLCVILE
jgi:hypothetical protein